MASKKLPWTRTVAVTGATGFIGQRLMSAFESSRIAARALVRSEMRLGQAETIVGTIGDAAALDRLVQHADTVVHMAGVAHTTLRNADEEKQAREGNVEGTRRLVAASAAAGVRHFILMSSAHVYQGQAGLNLTEDAATECDTPYGAMKLDAEAIVLAAASDRMRVTVLRPCLTYGPGVRFNLHSLLRAIRKRYYVHVRGRDVSRSLASVDTVAAAIVHLLDTETDQTTFNVADRSPVLLREWVDHLAELMQVQHPLTVPFGAMQIAATCGSILRGVGLPAPITRVSLKKLTTSFSISTDRLASTGFTWPETRETVLREMISAEFATSSISAS